MGNARTRCETACPGCAPSKEDIINDYVDELMQDGHLYRIGSAFSSPLFVEAGMYRVFVGSVLEAFHNSQKGPPAHLFGHELRWQVAMEVPVKHIPIRAGEFTDLVAIARPLSMDSRLQTGIHPQFVEQVLIENQLRL